MDRFQKMLLWTAIPFLFTTQVLAGNTDGRPRYIAPETFVEAPARVVAELKARGCMIPQASDGKAHNVIRGEFIVRGQVDWAALCSRQGKSSILLISDHEKKCPEHAIRQYAAYMQQIDRHKKTQYSRLIRKETRKGIVKRLGASEEPSPLAREQVDHDGIEDVYVGKASTILYCTEGKWVELDGAD
jgi:hypothetical protein